MSQVLLAKVSIPNLDVNNDPASIGFVFESDTASDYAHVSGITSAITTFFNTTASGGVNPVSSYYSDSCDRGTNHSSITYYDLSGHLDGSPHGAPVATATWTLGGATSGLKFPEGAAACLSFRSDYGTDVEFGVGTRPRARDRNRIYLGPLNAGCAALDSSTHRTEFAPDFINSVLHAAFTLAGTITTGGVAYVWRVWTRRGAAVKLIEEFWMDNRVDYQRRRSDQAPGTRTYLAGPSV